jgi:hypothetical protein
MLKIKADDKALAKLTLTLHFENILDLWGLPIDGKAWGKDYHELKHMKLMTCQRRRVLTSTPQEWERFYTYK